MAYIGFKINIYKICKCIENNYSPQNVKVSVFATELDKIITLWLRSSFAILELARKCFFCKPHLARTFVFNVYCVVWTFFFGTQLLMFPGLRIEAPLSSTVQGTQCIHIFLKQRSRKFNFRSYVLNLLKIKMFLFSKVSSPWADLSALRAQRALSVRSIYQPYVPQQSNRAGRFSGPPCQLDKTFGHIYRPSAAKGLTFALTDYCCSPYD